MSFATDKLHQSSVKTELKVILLGLVGSGLREYEDRHDSSAERGEDGTVSFVYAHNVCPRSMHTYLEDWKAE